MSCSELFKRIFQGCCLLFNYQGSFCFSTARLVYHIFFSLSRTFLHFSFVLFSKAFLYYHIHLFLSTFFTFFQTFSSTFSETNGLTKDLICIKSFNAEGGIRTHAPSRTNGFQDRLVMTTSIPLLIQFPSSPCDVLYLNTHHRICQQLF